MVISVGFSEASPKKKVKSDKIPKAHKAKSLAKELEESKIRMAALEEALKQERAEKLAWKATADALNSSNSIAEHSSIDFDGAPKPSSTRRCETALNADESRFLSSVNQLSVSSLNVPECLPLADDDDINRFSFEM